MPWGSTLCPPPQRPSSWKDRLLEPYRCGTRTDGSRGTWEEDLAHCPPHQALVLPIPLINHVIELCTNITAFLNQTLLLSQLIDGWAYLLAQSARFGLQDMNG